MPTVKVAIFGATGPAGRRLVQLMEEREFPVASPLLFASPKSIGKVIHFRGSAIRLQTPSESSLEGIQVAFFCAGAEVSCRWIPVVLRYGGLAIDTSDVSRRDPQVPLIVAGINSQEIRRHRGILACASPAVTVRCLALKPLDDLSPLKRVVVASLQGASAAGGRAVAELEDEMRSKVFDDRVFRREVLPRPLVGNLFPVDLAEELGETARILGRSSLPVAVSSARVPIHNGICEFLALEFASPVTPESAEKALVNTSNIRVTSEGASPLEASGQSQVLVGPIRQDSTVPGGLLLWLAGDPLLRGIALNALQVAEAVVNK